jgi:D-alanyl-lipoteichoic acid acyltransferase DltB (MBOAT superfamily)
MLFNSLDFAIFLPIVFLLYWFVAQKNLKLQNALIVLASYVFYGWWDWRFLSLIIFSTVVDYLVGQKLRTQEKQSKRKVSLWISILVNLGFLGFFKYYNFFLENFVDAFSLFGMQINANSLNIILPVGISFYTFQTLSYTIDVYKKKLEPTQDFIAFSAYVCFFPQLVAGPIERATNLLPQFYNKRTFEYHKAVNGMRQILWGLFKKVVIADNCAVFANHVFNNSDDMNGSTLVLGTIFFSFQIYGDFSGYSDIAIGTSRLFGFNIKQNFATPYFSRNILEFWKRWHISLTSWLTDYIFTPFAINYRHYGNKGIIISIFITFFLSGLWHGANWTFVIWGLLHAVYFLITILIIGYKTPKGIVSKNNIFPSLKESFSMFFTFLLVSFSYIFFRAKDVNHAFNYISKIFSNTLFRGPYFDNSLSPYGDDSLSINNLIMITALILFFLIIEWFGRSQKFAIEDISKTPKLFRIFFNFLIIHLLIIFGNHDTEIEFIYFQF